MPPAAPDARVHFRYTVTGSDSAKRASLTADGPLLVAAQHWFSKVLGPVLPPPAANGDYTVSVRLAHYIVEEELIFDDVVQRLCPSWSIRTVKLSALLLAAVEAGLDWTPVESQSLEHGAAIAKARVSAVIKSLPVASRTVASTDVLALPAGSQLGNFWEALSSRLLFQSGDSNNAMWVQLRCTFAYCFDLAELQGPHFAALESMMAPLCGASFQALPAAAQAAMVVRMLRRTRAPPELLLFVPAEACIMELVRRAEPSESARFLPLFESNWRGYAPLDRLWPHDMPGAEAARLASLLAVKVASGAALSDTVCQSICDSVQRVLSLLDTADLRGAANERRTHEVLLRISDLSDKKTSDKPATTETTQEHWTALFQTGQYRALYAKLEAQNVDNIDVGAVATLLARDPSPTGILFLCGQTVPGQPKWRQFADVAADSVLDSAVNSLISVDRRGESRPEWGMLVQERIGRRLVRGEFAITGDKALDWWSALCSSALAKRHGRHVHSDFDPPSPVALFCKPEILLDVRPTLEAAFAFIGFVGTAAGTFSSTMQGFHKRAEQITRLPDDTPQKPGLLRDYCHAVQLVIDEAADAFQLMRKAGPAFARRRFVTGVAGHADDVLFLVPGSLGGEKFVAIDRELEKILSQLEYEPERRDMLSLRGVGASSTSPTSKVSQRTLDFVLGAVPAAGGKDKGVTSDRGGNASKHGVWYSDPAGHLRFGRTVVSLVDGAPSVDLRLRRSSSNSSTTCAATRLPLPRRRPMHKATRTSGFFA